VLSRDGQTGSFHSQEIDLPVVPGKRNPGVIIEIALSSLIAFMAFLWRSVVLSTFFGADLNGTVSTD
jgi:hypothetical protein